MPLVGTNMDSINHWQIALNQVCVIPPKGTGYNNSSKWLTSDKAPAVYVDAETLENLDAVIDACLKAGEYSLLKYLHKFNIPDHTKVKRITARRKVLNLARSRKQDDVIALHKAGLRNREICIKLNCVKEYVSQVIKRYKDKENATTS